MWNGAIATGLATRRRDYALHFAALAFTLLSIAIALQFDGAAVTVGWAAEGAAIVALGLHERRNWLRLRRSGAVCVAISRTIELLTDSRAVSQAVLLNPRAGSAAFVDGVELRDRVAPLPRPEAPDRDAAIGASLVPRRCVGARAADERDQRLLA